LASFVGRERELGSVLAALRTSRLVSHGRAGWGPARPGLRSSPNFAPRYFRRAEHARHRRWLAAEDVPGLNDVGAVRHDEYFWPIAKYFFTADGCADRRPEFRRYAGPPRIKSKLTCEPLPPILSIEDAIARQSFLTDPNFIRRGDAARQLAQSELTLDGEFSFGGQEHFISKCRRPGPNAVKMGHAGHVLDAASVGSSTGVARVLRPQGQPGCPCNALGWAALSAQGNSGRNVRRPGRSSRSQNHRPVRVRPNRDLDMMLTGKRHPFLAKFKVGFSSDGGLLAAKSNCIPMAAGRSIYRSRSPIARCFTSTIAITSGRRIQRARRQNQSCVQHRLSRIWRTARHAGDRRDSRSHRAPFEFARRRVRQRNLYRGRGETTPPTTARKSRTIASSASGTKLIKTSAFEKRAWKFAVEFEKRSAQTRSRDRAGEIRNFIHHDAPQSSRRPRPALSDGTAQVNHGGTEMGQGVHTNIAAIAARNSVCRRIKFASWPPAPTKFPTPRPRLLPVAPISMAPPCATPCEILRHRLSPVATKLFAEKMGLEVRVDKLVFADNFVFDPAFPKANRAG